MPSLSLPLLLVTLAGATPPERPTENEPTERQIHQAVEASTGFLEREGVAWMKKQRVPHQDAAAGRLMAHEFAPRRADWARTRQRLAADEVRGDSLGDHRLSPLVSGARCG